MLLLGSCLALFAGPLILRVTGARPRVVAALDGFVLVGVLGLVFLHVIPDAMDAAGSAALVAAVVGILIPLFLEKMSSATLKKKTLRPAMLVLALVTLGLHGFMDGTALVEHHHHVGGASLGLGVLLHRIPMGLTLWWMVSSGFGNKAAMRVLVAMMAATLAGYFAGHEFVEGLSPLGFGIFQALMAGTILHVALDAPPVPASGFDSDLNSLNTFALLGSALGALVVWTMGHDHGVTHLAHAKPVASEIFWTLTLHASPPLLIAFVGSGLLHGFVQRDCLKFLKTGSRLVQSAKVDAANIPVPIGSQGVLEFYRSMNQWGLSPTAAVAFLIARAPLGLAAVLLSVPFLGVHLTLARVAVAVGIAVLSGWMLSRFFVGNHQHELNLLHGPSDKRHEDGTVQVGSMWTRLQASFRFGLVDVVDDILPWVILGIGVGALAEPVLELASFAEVPDSLEVLLAALVGIPIYICASGATPLGAVLLHKGFSSGALIAFLMTGPATNFSTFEVLRRLHSKRAIWAMASAVLCLSIIFGLGVNALMPPTALPNLGAFVSHEETWWELSATYSMGILLLACLVRLGPRGFIARVVPGVPSSVLIVHASGDENGH